MPVRSSRAVWQGTAPEGHGTVRVESGIFESAYTFASRFADGKGTNPEELLGAAHAACYAMALSSALTKAGFVPEQIDTEAKVQIEKIDDGFLINHITLITRAMVPGVTDAEFQQFAEKVKTGCPVSKALAAVPEITLDAKLIH